MKRKHDDNCDLFEAMDEDEAFRLSNPEQWAVSKREAYIKAKASYETVLEKKGADNRATKAAKTRMEKARYVANEAAEEFEWFVNSFKPPPAQKEESEKARVEPEPEKATRKGKRKPATQAEEPEPSMEVTHAEPEPAKVSKRVKSTATVREAEPEPEKVSKKAKRKAAQTAVESEPEEGHLSGAQSPDAGMSCTVVDRKSVNAAIKKKSITERRKLKEKAYPEDVPLPETTLDDTSTARVLRNQPSNNGSSNKKGAIYFPGIEGRIGETITNTLVYHSKVEVAARLPKVFNGLIDPVEEVSSLGAMINSINCNDSRRNNLAAITIKLNQRGTGPFMKEVTEIQEAWVMNWDKKITSCVAIMEIAKNSYKIYQVSLADNHSNIFAQFKEKNP